MISCRFVSIPVRTATHLKDLIIICIVVFMSLKCLLKLAIFSGCLNVTSLHELIVSRLNGWKPVSKWCFMPWERLLADNILHKLFMKSCAARVLESHCKCCNALHAEHDVEFWAVTYSEAHVAGISVSVPWDRFESLAVWISISKLRLIDAYLMTIACDKSDCSMLHRAVMMHNLVATAIDLQVSLGQAPNVWVPTFGVCNFRAVIPLHLLCTCREHLPCITYMCPTLHTFWWISILWANLVFLHAMLICL